MLNVLAGTTYFQSGHRMFATDAEPCMGCVIVHNTHIGTSAAKAYRFKENLMWMVDTDGYYTNPDAKYLTYNNPVYFHNRTGEKELEALHSALRIGHVLNRIVILPKFHCPKCKNVNICKNKFCPLNSLIKIAVFDSYFGGKYRENVFLHHPMVPHAVTNSQSPLILITTSIDNLDVDMFDNTEEQNLTYSPKDDHGGATSEEISTWFEPFQNYSVLCFHSVYDALVAFSSDDDEAHFEEKLKAGFIPANYSQFH